ncbi:MAG: hypothetical protein OXG44_06140 [Gammaproteobacteria bacterium]|nr:hypothetical protein [Gammaproteobacteria bacterium]
MLQVTIMVGSEDYEVHVGPVTPGPGESGDLWDHPAHHRRVITAAIDGAMIQARREGLDFCAD